MRKTIILLGFSIPLLILSACNQSGENKVALSNEKTSDSISKMQEKVNQYAVVDLKTDLSKLSDKQKKMLPLLIQASQIMDTLFAYQTYGNIDSLKTSLSDEATKEFVTINYGPWDRLRNDAPFIDGVEEKPKGANFYPSDMTKEEFEKANLDEKAGLYNFIRRDKRGNLVVIPYHEKFKNQLNKAANLLRNAADFAETEGFKKYLNLRADALVSDQFRASDLAWLDMKENKIGLVIGPIETYEDQLFGYKASYEAYVLVKDVEWSQKLSKFAAYLPELQQKLPVEEQYKQENPGSDADLNAYQVIYYAGAANAGGKTIAINLPNDEQVQLKKGTRRLQLKNAMRAKFDKILLPISKILITPEQRNHITFDAFFANTMFHEVAHGLGIKNTINGKGTVRKALKEYASALEEGKADVLGLYMVEQLIDKGAIQGDIKDYYTTFIASIFRSVRFGAGDAHGIANMIRFNYFKEHHAFSRLKDGTYKVSYDKMHQVVEDLSRLILTLQGDGAYKKVADLVEKDGVIKPQLQKDLDRLKEAHIPLDVVFNQGAKVLGL